MIIKIIIAEIKSSSVRIQAKSGNKTKLESDLKKVLRKAYQQAKRTSDYVLTTEIPVFRKVVTPYQ